MRASAILAILLLAISLAGCVMMSAPLEKAPSTTPSTPANETTAAPTTPAPAEQPKAPASATVEISGYKFTPATVTIAVGGTVTWVNKDNAVHSVVFDGDSFEPPNLHESGIWGHEFKEAGEFPYHCGVHPTMKGTVIVV
jgi:plastocyanin